MRLFGIAVSYSAAGSDGQGDPPVQDAGVEPDVWKIEGLDGRALCEGIVSTVRRGGRDRVGCIVLGRGEDDARVRSWLSTAAGVRGFTGFAVGRTTFWQPLLDWRAKKRSRARPRSTRLLAATANGSKYSRRRAARRDWCSRIDLQINSPRREQGLNIDHCSRRGPCAGSSPE
jgi:hypothetical protein